MIPYDTVRSYTRHACGEHKPDVYRSLVQRKAVLSHVNSSSSGEGQNHNCPKHWSHVSQGSDAWDDLLVEAVEEKDRLVSKDGRRHFPDKLSSIQSSPLHGGHAFQGISRATTGSATHAGLDQWPSQVEPLTYSAYSPKNTKSSSTVPESCRPRLHKPPGSVPSSTSENLLLYPGCSPWTGDQSVNDLPQGTVRQGVSSKRLVKDEKDEISTARHCVLPCLYEYTGSKSLAGFFNNILQERKASTQLPNVNTSGGPKRVTLTEQKRDAWLTKLADPTIPLRKQCRSIPHGLHGRLLLEQCVSKNVPIARAVWLIKHAGPDSLRSMYGSSNGTTGTAESQREWLKDWTVVVESFARTLDSREGHAQQEQQATYFARLSARLYDAALLDCEHYLDWVLNRLEQCSLDNLSLALFMVQTHRAKLTSNKYYGQRLAIASTLRLRELSELSPINESFKEAHARLDNLVQELASVQFTHFALPTMWQQVRHMFVEKRSTAKVPSIVVAMQRIISMNDRLSLWLTGTYHNPVRPTQAVVEALDHALPHLDVAVLSSTLRNLIPDLNELVTCLITWATSKYRADISRLHLACRLTRLWHGHQMLRSHDTISYALTRLIRSESISMTALVRFCMEMNRSSHFDSTAYLQQLAVTQPSVKTHKRSFLSLLVAQISASDVPTSLRGLGIESEDGLASKTQVIEVKQQIAAQFKSKIEGSDVGHQEDYSTPASLQKLALRDRFELSKSLRSSLLSSLARRTEGPDTSLPLHFVRAVVILLEDLDDYLVLVDVLMTLVPCCKLEGLELVALSVETQEEKFAAMGSHTKLWQTLFSRYTALRLTNNPPHKDLCRFFLRTTYWYRTTPKLEQHLNREIEFCDTGFAACTPLSEMQIDTAEDGKSDLDRILANGPKLANEDLSTALHTILAHLCHVKQISEAQAETIKTNLTALKTANEIAFAAALADWARSQVTALEHRPLARALALLLVSESMSIAALLECVGASNDRGLGDASRQAEPRAALKLLHFFFFEAPQDPLGIMTAHADEDNSLHMLDNHRRWSKQLWRKQLLRSHGASLIRLLGACLKLQPELPHDCEVRSLCTSQPFISMVQHLLAVSPGLIHGELAGMLEVGATVSRDNFRYLLAVILDLPGRLSTPDCAPQDLTHISAWTTNTKIVLIGQLFESVDACSLPTIQLALKLATAMDDCSDSQVVLQSCFDGITASSKRQCPLWSQLVPHIDTYIGKQLHTMSERALLFSLEDETALTRMFLATWSTTPATHATIINATKRSILSASVSDIGRAIVEHLILAVKAIDDQLLAASSDFIDWIRALISISLVYEQAFTMSANLTQLLYALCRITSFDCLQMQHELIELARDATCVFLPRVTVESLHQLKKALEPFLNNYLLRELLDLPAEADASLCPTVDITSFLTPRAFQDSYMAMS